MENVINKKSILVVGVIVTILTMGLLCGCSNSASSTFDSSNETTSSKSAGDGWTQVDTSWAYKVDGTKTIFKRSDGYEFTVKAECGSVYTPTPEKEQAKSSFGTKGDVLMSFDIANDEDLIQKQLAVYDSSTYSVVEKDDAKCFWSEKYSSTNSVKIWYEKENLWLNVIYGTETVTRQSTVEEILNEFEF